MKKRGMLLASEVLKMVLGLIGIALLIYLLTALYFSNMDQKKLVQAEATIDRISGAVREFQYNSSYVEKLNVVVPIKWTIFSYVGPGLKPNQCVFENCICICDEVREDFWIYVDESRQEEECSDGGACFIIKNLEKFDNIYIEKPTKETTNLRIYLEGGLVKVRKI